MLSFFKKKGDFRVYSFLFVFCFLINNIYFFGGIIGKIEFWINELV